MKRILFGIILFGMGFVAAFFVFHLKKSVLTISNKAPATIKDVVLFGPGIVTHAISGEIPQNGTMITVFYIDGEGEVRYSMNMGPKQLSGVLFANVKRGSSQEGKILVDEQTKVTVTGTI